MPKKKITDYSEVLLEMRKINKAIEDALIKGRTKGLKDMTDDYLVELRKLRAIINHLNDGVSHG